MTGRKLAAHVRRLMDELDRRDALRAAVDAMRAIRLGSQSVNPLARRMLDDAAMRSLLRQDDALGVIGQAISAPALEKAYRATSTQRRKFTEAEIPSVTQLFTPRWVIEFLLQN